jgi:hypothetical protein
VEKNSICSDDRGAAFDRRIKAITMSKAKGIHTIRGKEPVMKVSACAVEYDSGELYYDRTGRVVRQLNKRDSSWLREATIGTKQTQVLNAEHGLLFTFGPGTASVTLSTENQPEGIEPEDVTRLINQAAFALSIIVDEFELPDFQRIEYRERYSFAFPSVEETEAWIRDLGLIQVHDSLYTSFGQHYALNCTLLFVGDECRYQLQLAGMERPAKVPVGPGELTFKHSRVQHLNRPQLLKLEALKRHQQLDPEFFAILDIIAYLWDDTDADFDIAAFAKRRTSQNLELFRQCISSIGKQVIP